MSVPFIPDSYTRASAILDILTDDISHQVTAGEKAILGLVNVRDRLAAMAGAYPDGYLNAAQYIIAQANAHPDDPAWGAMKAKLDKLVQDFQVYNSRFTTIVAAIDGM